MSHVEATTGSQTSTFAFASRLKIKSVQLITVTSCTYLSKSVYYTLKSQGASDSKHESKPRNLWPKKSVYYTLKSQGASDSKHESKPRNLRPKKVHTIHSKSQGASDSKQVEAKKPRR